MLWSLSELVWCWFLCMSVVCSFSFSFHVCCTLMCISYMLYVMLPCLPCHMCSVLLSRLRILSSMQIATSVASVSIRCLWFHVFLCIMDFLSASDSKYWVCLYLAPSNFLLCFLVDFVLQVYLIDVEVTVFPVYQGSDLQVNVWLSEWSLSVYAWAYVCVYSSYSVGSMLHLSVSPACLNHP